MPRTTSIALVAGFAALQLFALGCEQLPAKIDESATVDQYLAQQRYRAACVGLESQDPEIKTYTAQRMSEYGHVKDARECLCAGLYDTKRHTIDTDVGRGIEGSDRDDLADCLVPALTDDKLTDEARTNAVRILGDIGAKNAYETLAELAKNDGDEEIRAIAVAALRASRASTEDIIAILKSDKSGAVRAGAASALEGHKGDEVQEALIETALNDEDGNARAAALAVLAKGKRSSKIDDMLCTAMMEDESAAVRTSAVKAYHGTKRKKAIDCLEKRIMTPEESPEVRQALMDALKASPNDAVKPVLCNAVPVIARHIKGEPPDSDNDASGTHIMKAQNDRDWEGSYACVQKAMGASGLSCEGRWYLTNWYNVLGGNKALPMCPGTGLPSGRP